jgi:endonuclease/exonuclease/phosphatase family metal-dependent hydrolase
MVSHGSPPSEAELARMPNRLTILTWNTHQMGQYRKSKDNEVLKYLLTQDADIICLQEVDVYKNPEFLTLAEVRHSLGAKYPYSYIDFSVYNNRRQFGNMVWSRYPLINKKTVDYEIRSNLSSRCDVVIGEDTLRLIVNHLESNRFTSTDMTINDGSKYEDIRNSAKRIGHKWTKARNRRRGQARAVRKEIDNSPYPVIVVGDFNDIPLSYTYYTISKGLHDAWLETSWGKWGTTFKLKGSFGVRIDYILCQNPLVPVQCTVKETTGSDHSPVEAVLAW